MVLPLYGLWLNASKPEPSLEGCMGNQLAVEAIGPKLALCGLPKPKFTSRLMIALPGLYEAEWTGGRKA